LSEVLNVPVINTNTTRLVAVVVLITTVSFSYQKNQHEYPLKESSLLWKIESPHSKKVSYLFGTMHLIEKEYFIDEV
jgi:uncharacterized protein YbaP (TraB family)